jgi:Zn ribbon nucleic-acid-binding protein
VTSNVLIIGTKVFFWGSERAAELMRCGTCGFAGPFIRKTGMRFLTLFFIIPTIPLSGFMHVAQCPQCRTRYKAQ